MFIQTVIILFLDREDRIDFDYVSESICLMYIVRVSYLLHDSGDVTVLICH